MDIYDVIIHSVKGFKIMTRQAERWTDGDDSITSSADMRGKQHGPAENDGTGM